MEKTNTLIRARWRHAPGATLATVDVEGSDLFKVETPLICSYGKKLPEQLTEDQKKAVRAFFASRLIHQIHLAPSGRIGFAKKPDFDWRQIESIVAKVFLVIFKDEVSLG